MIFNSNLNTYSKMKLNKRNDYVDTIKPILCFMKIMAILPVQFTFKDYGINFLKSKTILVISLCLYHINLMYTMAVAYYDIDNLWRRFSLKVFIALIPSFLAKISIFIVPWKVWSNAKQMEDYWKKWQRFQNDYKNVTGEEFVSDTKMLSYWCSIMAIILTVIAEIMGNLYLFRDNGIWAQLSEGVNIGIAYRVGVYWFMNYMYSRSCAVAVISLVKETLSEGTNNDRFDNLIYLWVLLCDLVEQFNVLHSTMFLFFIGGTVLSTILFAFISMNYSNFSDAWSRGTSLNSTIVCGLMILGICEMGYSVYKQVNIQHRRTLLEYNTIQMKTEMLQSVALSSNITSVINPEIHINGFFALNRAVFPTILAICINLLIILRQFQFQPGKKSID